MQKWAAWLKRPDTQLWLLGLIGLSFLLNQLLQGYFQTLYFDGPAADGVFQLFNPLRRLDAGMQPGQDFQFFHGLGTLLIHFPFFKLLGGDLFASELTRWWITAVLFQLGNLLLLRAMRVPWKWSLILSLLVFMAKEALMIEELSIPGNSLLGVRSFWPLLAIAGLLWWSRRPPLAGPWGRFTLPLFAGCLAAFGLLFSTEHGLALSLGLAVTVTIYPYPDHPGWRSPLRWTNLLLYAVSVLVFGGLLFLATAGAGAGSVLRYNFLTVPLDQFWYFGVPPNPFVSTLRHGLPPILALRALLAVVIGWGLWHSSRSARRGLLPASDQAIVLGALVYGLLSTVSNLGYSTLLYSAPLWRLEILLLLGGSYQLLRPLFARPPLAKLRAPIARGVLLLLALYAVVYSLESDRVLSQQKLLVSQTNQKVSGAYLSDNWRSTYDVWDSVFEGETLQTGDVWSTYASLLEAEHKLFHPTTDYIIHALGPEGRDEYLSQFQAIQPRYVQTLYNSPFFAFETWLESTSWDFYDLLITNYRPIARTPYSWVWERTEDPYQDLRSEGFVPVPHEPESSTIMLNLPLSSLREQYPDQTSKLAVIEVHYSIHQPLAAIPVLGRLPRFFLEPRGTVSTLPISLPPYRDSIRFPLVLDLNAPRLPILSLVTTPKLGASFEVTSVAIKLPDLPPDRERTISR